MATTLDSVIKRLDRLDDRKQDGTYYGLPLNIEKAAEVCRIKKNDGSVVKVDCKKLVKKLDLLIGIAEKNPATRFRVN